MKLDNLNEIKKFISDRYKYRTELHAHTSPVSSCADFSPEDVVKRYAELGYSSVAITNHYTYDYRFIRFENEPGAEKFVKWFMKDFNQAKKAGKKYGINVILGAELRFMENHNDYLVYGIDEDMLKKFYDVLESGIAEFKKNEAFKDLLIIQAHPKRNSITEIDPSYVDGMETFNLHFNHNGKIAKAVKDAKEKGIKLTTIGSDYHHEGGEGLGAIRTREVIKDTYELAEVLRSGDYIFDISEDILVLP